jgi:hypothetical protein
MAVKRKTKSTKEEDGLYSEFGLFLEKVVDGDVPHWLWLTMGQY